MVKMLLVSADHRIYKGKFFSAPSLKEGMDYFRSLGFTVNGPMGNVPPHFILLLESEIEGEFVGGSYRHPDWRPLREVAADEEIFQAYVDLMFGGYVPPERNFDVFFFGAGPLMASKLAHLVIKGRKRGSAGWIRFHEKTGTALPKAGGICLVTDGVGIPLCFIQTLGVEKVQFKNVTEEMARVEGEGDLSLEDWRRVHWEFWNIYDAQEIGEAFSEDEYIYFERFKVLKVLGKEG